MWPCTWLATYIPAQHIIYLESTLWVRQTTQIYVQKVVCRIWKYFHVHHRSHDFFNISWPVGIEILGEATAKIVAICTTIIIPMHLNIYTTHFTHKKCWYTPLQ